MTTGSVTRVIAHNSASESENKIHDDRVAAAYGFRGGLVPGVTVYGYMTLPLQPEWFERGAMTVRFVAPTYEGETVVIKVDGGEIRAEREDGMLCATGTVTIPADIVFQAFPRHPLPQADARPQVAHPLATQLGSLHEPFSGDETIPYAERILRLANEIMVRNYRMSAWIHTASEVRHHSLAQPGEPIVVCGEILINTSARDASLPWQECR